MTLALYGKSRRRQWMLVALAVFALFGALSAALAVRQSANAVDSVPLHDDHVGTQNSTFKTGSCPTPPAGQEGWWGWHFLMPGNNNFTSLSVTFASAGTFSADPFPGTVFVASPDNSHAYIWTPTDDTLTAGTATSDGENSFFNLSHVCPGSADPEIDIDKSNDTGDNIVNPGDSFNWIIKVTVTGAATSAATSITDTIPADFNAGAPVETSAHLDCSASSDNSIDCTLASGAPVGEYTITVPVDVSGEPRVCGEPITNTAEAQMGTEPAIDDDDDVTINCGQTIVTTVRVCKVFEDNADGNVRGDTKFDFEIDYLDDSQTSQTAQTSITLGEGEGPECKEVELLGSVGAATFTELATPITDETGYPKHQVMDGSTDEGYSVGVIIWSGEGCSDESQVDFLREAQTQELEYDGTCQVTFYNKEVPGEVSPTGDLRIEKYLDINGDGDADDVALGEGPIAGWNMTVSGPDENGVFPTGAGGSVSFSGLNTGDNYAVTEALPAGWVLTNVQVDGADSAVNVTKNVTIPDGGTRVVAYYNQPLGSLNVHKDAVTSHNGGPNVPAPQDDDGWSITVSSATCNFTDTKQTDASGNASFTGLPLCTDYVVSENTVNADSPGFAPISATSVAGQTPSGQTITFVNRRVTFDPPCQDCIQIIPTPTPTTPPPTATPTNTPVPPTATPTPEEATEGERTPGPTPIAPSTGTGGSGGSGSMNILLLALGLAALSGGMSLAAAGRRRRN